MGKKYHFLALLFILSMFANAQIITIPDANFKAKLLQANTSNQIASSNSSYFLPMKIDANDNGEIEENEALSVRMLYVNDANISSLSGLASFANLRQLVCNNNNLTSLDVNSLTFLRLLNCSHNLLTALNCQSIDNRFVLLDASYNSLTSFALPNFYEFEDMGDQTMAANLSHNLLTAFTLTDNEQLSLLDLSFNNLTTISFNHLEVYGSLQLSNNPLTTLDLSSVYLGVQDLDSEPSFSLENTNLTELYVPFNITRGNISNNPNLVHLNIKNGNYNYGSEWEIDENGEETGNVIYYGIRLSNNPQLGLICCDSGEEFYYLGVVSPSVQVTPYCTFTPGGNYNAISGTITYNCPNGMAVNSNVKVIVNNDYQASFAEEGNFVAYTGYGVQNVSLRFLEPNYFTVTPHNYNFNFTGTGNTETANFCITPNGNHPDLMVSFLPITIARPGFDARYKLIVKNKGTATQSGTVTLNFEENVLDYVSALPAVSVQNSGLLSWNFSDLHPFEDKEIEIILNLNSPVETPAVVIGDVLHYSAAITTAQTDDTPADNNSLLNQTVIGSMDPNDKTVLEGSQVSITRVGEYLNYLIRFQNMGTAAAENVVVLDVLDYKFDPTSLQMLSASHPCRSVLTDGTKLEAIFENINLPPSITNEPASHGYVAFRVKPRSATVINDVLENKAHIYFDYNAPITTNTVSTTFTTLGITDHESELFKLYPNPTSDILNIVVSNGQAIKNVRIATILGQIVMAFENESTFDLSQLAKGTYFITVETDSAKETRKIVKL